MADFAHEETEKILKALEQKIAHMYDESAKELQEEIDKYFAEFVERDKKIKEQIGKIHNGKEFTEQDYLLWRQNQFGRGQRLEALKDKLAERATNANEVAISYVNDETPGVYSLNRNYTAYTIDKATGGGMSFHKNGSLNADFILFDEQTVKRLVKETPDLMPYYPAAKAIKRGIDLEYGKSQITKSITSGIMQGKSIGKIANDLQQHITDMNRASAVRAARTAMTGAQNAGRQDSYIQAEKMGIKVRKRWIATKDNRTRHSHGMLDGQTVPADEPFVSILGSRMMFPGDASGAVAGDLYNCRCTMRTVEKDGIEAEPRQMRVRDPETGKNVLVSEMTYQEWLSKKQAEAIINNSKEKYPEGMTMAANRGIISEEDLRAINLYKSSYSYILNEALRNREILSDEDRVNMRAIDQAISKLPKYEGIVYRSLDSSKVMDLDNFWQRYQPGNFCREEAYTSTSTEIYDEGMDIQMIIYSHHGYDMRKYNVPEQEIIFKRETLFWVEKVEGNTIWLTEV